MKQHLRRLGCVGLVCLLSGYGSAQTPGSLKWSVLTNANISSSPAIGLDGTIYIGSGSGDNRLHAINPDGTEKWNFLTDGDVDSSPAIGPDGTIYFGSYDDYIRAVSPAGIEKWRFYVSHYVQSAPAISADGTIYVGSGGPRTLFAINPDGTEKWRFSTGGEISYSSPVIGNDDVIYVGSSDNCLYAINPDGSQKWKYQLGGSINSPAIGSDGTIYVGCSDGSLRTFDPSGNPKWTFAAGAALNSPTIGKLETIYVGAANGVLYALNKDGSQKWNLVTGNSFSPSAAISRDGTLYIGSSNILYAVSQYGSLSWTFSATGHLGGSAPAIGSDGTVFLGASDGRLYAVNGTGMGLAHSSWPMFHHDNEHTGMAAQTGWPMFGNDAHHSFRTQLQGPFNAVLKWSKNLGDIEPSYPIVGANGTIYFGGYSAQGSAIYAISPEGQELWVQKGMATRAQPALSPDENTLYIASYIVPDTAIYALRTVDGSVRWRFGLATYTPPVVASDGTIYIVSNQDLYSIRPDGFLNWQLHLTDYWNALNSAVAINPFDGTIYVGGGGEGKLFAITAAGLLRWAFPSTGKIDSAGAVSFDPLRSTVFVGANKWIEQDNQIFGTLYAVNTDGTERWNYKTTKDDLGNSNSASFVFPPAIGKDGNLYLVTGGGTLLSLDADGRFKWRSAFGESYYSRWPVVDSDNKIYVAGGGGLAVSDPDGNIKVLPPSDPSSIINSIVIGTCGVAYGIEDSSRGSFLYAFGKQVPPAITSFNPASASGGGPPFTLSVIGSDFLEGAIVRWDGNDRPTAFIDSQMLDAQIGTEDLANGHIVQVSVQNPDGGISNTLEYPVSSFLIGSSPSSATVTAGQAATYTIQVSPLYGIFDSSVSFSCTGLPPKCTASFSPTNVTPGASAITTTLTLTTKSTSTSAGGITSIWRNTAIPVSGILLSMMVLLFPFADLRKPTRQSIHRRLVAGISICVIILIASCSAGGDNNNPLYSGTPKGTHQITVQGTSGGLTASTTITLVVR